MSYTTIDTRTQSHSFDVLFVHEDVNTTMSLVNMGDGKLGLIYDSHFSGIKSGHVHGGPITVEGNIDKVVHDSPKVSVIIIGFNQTASYVSMHVTIEVDIPVLGSKTIFSKTLGGAYQTTTGWAAALTEFNQVLGKRKAK